MAPLLKKEDGAIDWTLSARRIANRIRGLSPWPGAYTAFNGERWVLWKAMALPADASRKLPAGSPGAILAAGKEGLLVMTGEGWLNVLEIQPANGRRMTIGQYLAGHALSPGQALTTPEPAPASDS
jgi:methionyl-tRNA formyltransferase